MIKLLFATLLLCAACTQALDLQNYEKGTLGTLTSCGGLTYPNEVCGACMSRCCDEAAACAADPACSTIEDCYAHCKAGDVDCFGTCTTSTPYDTHAMRALESCLVKQCTNECEIGCERMKSPTLARCFRLQPGCCAAERAVLQDDAAFSWWDCQSQCHPVLTTLPGVDACGCLTDRRAEPVVAVLHSCQAACSTLDPDLSCVGKIEWPKLNEGPTINYELHVADAITAQAVVNARVSVCQGSDLLCSAPTSVITTDQRGVATLRLPSLLNGAQGFFSYLLLQADGYVDSPYYWFPPPQQSEVSSRLMLTPASRELLYAGSGITLDPSKGVIAFAFTDCNVLGPMAGVKISSDPPGQTAYTINGLADTTAGMSGPAGFGAVVNLDPGLVRITATHVPTNRVLSKVDVVVRANGYTIVKLPPTPVD